MQNYMLTQSYMLTSLVRKSWQQQCCAGCKGPTGRLNHSHAGYTSFGYIRQHWSPGLERGISGRPCLPCMSQYRFPPASAVKCMKSILSVCVWQLFSTLTGEPLDLLTLVWVMTFIQLLGYIKGLVQKKWSQSVTWRSKNESQKWCLGFIFLENRLIGAPKFNILPADVYLMNRMSYGQGQEKWGRLHFFWTRPKRSWS